MCAPTTPLPEQAMCKVILGTVRVREQAFVNVLNFIIASTSSLVIGTTVVDVYVATQCLAKQIAQHWGTFIIGGESSAFDLKYRGIVRAIYSPPCLGHGPVTCFVLLLGMACIMISHNAYTPTGATIPSGRVQKYPQFSHLSQRAMSEKVQHSWIT